MILHIKNNPDSIEKGEVVVFITGKNSIHGQPKYLRVGEVIDPDKWVIREISTGKTWRPYTQNIIRIGDGVIVQGVKSQITLTPSP